MAGEGTSYTIDIDAPADSAEAAAAAVDTLAARLKDASAAATSAADAVKAGEAAYKQAEATADRTAKAVEKIGIAADAQRGKMAEAMKIGDERAFWRAAAGAEKLAARQAEAVTKANAAKAAMQSQAVALDRMKAASDAAAGTQTKLAQSLDKAKAASERAAKAQAAAAGSGDLGKLKGALEGLGGPLGNVSGKALGATEALQKLGQAAGSAGPYVALAVAIVAVATALAVAVVATAAWSIKLTDAARSSQLLSDGIAGSVEAGSELDYQIKNLSKRVPQTRDELRAMAADLAKTGLKGDALSAALAESAEKAAALKWGPDFAKQTKSLGKLSERFSNNLSDLFGGLDIEPLLDGLSKLVDLFDSGSTTGKVMRDVFESLFQPLIDGVANVIPKVIAGFIQMQIWVLKALIFIKPFGSTILEVAQAIGFVLLVALVSIAAAFAVVAAAVAACWVVILSLGKAMQWVTETVIGAGKAIYDFFANLSLSEIGSSLIDGLIAGLIGGGPGVIQAITGIAGSAINAAKSALGIASPSKVFEAIGANTAEGMAGGVEANTSAVTGALDAMVTPPSTGGGTDATAPAASGGNTYQIIIEGAGKQAKEIVDEAEAMLMRLLDGDVTQVGGAVPSNG